VSVASLAETRGIGHSVVAPGGGERRQTNAQVVPYDFRRPNKFNREHIRAFEIANETFARQFTTVLSTTLRTVSQVSLLSVSQLTYDEYVRSLPNPSYLAILALDPLPGAATFHLPLPVVMTAIDRLLGGTGEGYYPERPLTDIEDVLIRDLMARVLHELSYAWESITELEARVVQQESNPQFVQIAAPSDMVVTIAFDVRVGGQHGEATLCIPFTSLQPALDAITEGSLVANRTRTSADTMRHAVATRLADVPLDVSVRFDEVHLASSDIVNLQVGDVIPLRHPVGSALTVSVAGEPRFHALAGRNGKRLACRIIDPNAKDPE
jgi:flagellar motor switch protein FliM